MNLSQQLKKWRGADATGRGTISQTEAAEFLGVNLRTFQDWELGRAMPRGIGLSALLQRLESKPKTKRPNEHTKTKTRRRR